MDPTRFYSLFQYHIQMPYPYRFFYNLNYFLLAKLQLILDINEEEGRDAVHLYPKDLVQLGLDPQADVAFVKELAELYFKKRVLVNGLTDLAYISSTSVRCCCCCYPCRQRTAQVQI